MKHIRAMLIGMISGALVFGPHDARVGLVPMLAIGLLLTFSGSRSRSIRGNGGICITGRESPIMMTGCRIYP